MNALEFRFAFNARDFDKSVSFYRDILGLKYISGWDRDDDKGALLSAGGTAVVEIFGEPQGKTYEGPSPTAVNLALRLENVSAVDIFMQSWLPRVRKISVRLKIMPMVIIPSALSTRITFPFMCIVN